VRDLDSAYKQYEVFEGDSALPRKRNVKAAERK